MNPAVVLCLCSMLLCIMAGGAGSPAVAEDMFGKIEFGGWALDWELKDNTGLALRNVFYQKEKVLAKASMPVIRVKYIKERHWWNPFSLGGSRAATGRCGPFQDRLSWTNSTPISDCGGNKICIQSYSQNGIKWLELGIYARIGEYHIYQAWYLNENGEIHPVVHSRGLSCNTDHVHHPYWRFDFDIDGSGLDQVFRHDEGGTEDTGWGPGWHKYTNEQNDIRLPATNRVWFVRDQPTGHGAWIIPGAGYAPLKDDGVRDDFSDIDVAIRRSKRTEDEPWPFGARGELAYDEDREGVQEQDIVFWYTAHLPHMAALGPLKWLAIGPVIRVQR
jgi:hypothetical protein